jgi:hypothetical protein
VLNDLLVKTKNAPAAMERFHDDMIKMAILQLSKNPNALVRKRAISMLGYLSAMCSDAALNRMVGEVIKVRTWTVPAFETISLRCAYPSRCPFQSRGYMCDLIANSGAVIIVSILGCFHGGSSCVPCISSYDGSVG